MKLIPKKSKFSYQLMAPDTDFENQVTRNKFHQLRELDSKRRELERLAINQCNAIKEILPFAEGEDHIILGYSNTGKKGRIDKVSVSYHTRVFASEDRISDELRVVINGYLYKMDNTVGKMKFRDEITIEYPNHIEGSG